MQAIRTIIWVIIAVVLTAFVAMNSETVSLNVWPDGEGYSHLKWPLALVIIVSFALGFVPNFLAYRAAKWASARKIKQLEDTINLLRTPAPAPAPVAVAPAPAPAPTPLDPGPLL